MFNSLSFSGGELLKNADAVLEDDSPFAPGANGKPFALAIDSVAHLFHASGRAGALPASVFSPASSSDIFAVGVASSLSDTKLWFGDCSVFYDSCTLGRGTPGGLAPLCTFLACSRT